MGRVFNGGTSRGDRREYLVSCTHTYVYMYRAISREDKQTSVRERSYRSGLDILISAIVKSIRDYFESGIMPTSKRQRVVRFLRHGSKLHDANFSSIASLKHGEALIISRRIE